MKVRCGKCKSSDIEAAYPPTRVEEKLAWFLPLSPYQCDKCERRFLSWANPLMDRNRSISSGVLVGLLSLGVILMAISEPDLPASITQPSASTKTSEPRSGPESPAPSEQSDAAAGQRSTTQAEPPNANPASDQGITSPDSAEGPVATVTEPPSTAPAAVDTTANGAPPVRDSRYSASVLHQLEKNQARDRGAPLSGPAQSSVKPEPAGADPTATPTKSVASSSKPEAAAAKPADATPSAQAKPAPPTPKPVVAKATARARLDDLRIEQNGDSLDLHIVGSGSLMPEGKLLTKVYYVDLPGKWEVKRGLGDRKLDHPLTTGMRLGKHPDHLRIAFDLKDKPVKISFKIEPSGLLLHLAPKE